MEEQDKRWGSCLHNIIVSTSTINHHQTTPQPLFCNFNLRTSQPAMLSQTLRMRSAQRAFPSAVRAFYSTGASSTNVQTPPNDPTSRAPQTNVSATNVQPTSSEGAFDKILQESAERGTELREMQAPNRKGIWSRSQQPRELAMTGPRFEQTILEDQVRGRVLRV